MAGIDSPDLLEARHPFKGRSVAVVNDLTIQEQWFLYQKTRELKEAVASRGDLEPFRCRDPEAAVYTIFMEDSTRTKESFRNAAEFHGMKVNMFDSKTSSFQKNETITDTVKMLVGYSTGQSIFVIRSKVEGVCRWLEEAIAEFATLRNFPRASFVNAGDGRHEHPTQEFLDEFSFLEQKGWEADSIHLALLGDLFHGRTVHSKVEGLRLYGHVEVDLIAPGELALPAMYEDRMRSFGFQVRTFASIAEYLAQDKVAKIWYFTRLQLERMGEKVLAKSEALRKAVTFQQEFLPSLPKGTKFFHPLPRDARHPVLPFWLDSTEYNGWDQQSQNGYFTRIVLLGMLSGLLGSDLNNYQPAVCTPRGPSRPLAQPNSPGSPLLSAANLSQADLQLLSNAPDFVLEVSLEDEGAHEEACRSGEVGLVPISSGVIIDRIAEGQEPEKMWALMYMLRSILGLRCVGGMGVYHTSTGRPAGFVSFPGYDASGMDRLPLKKLAATAPGSNLCVMEDGKVTRKFQLHVPPRIYNIPEVSCKNTSCISYKGNMQHEVTAYFYRVDIGSSTTGDTQSYAFTCKYCEHRHSFSEIWDYKYYQGLPVLHQQY